MNINAANSNSPAGGVWSSASTPKPPAQKMANLFDQIDSSGSGSISQSQFEQAFKSMNPPASVKSAGADSVWSKLDPNGTGSVSKQDFVKSMVDTLKQLRGHHHHHKASEAGAQSLVQNASQLGALGSASASPSTPPATGATGAGSIIDLLV
jgi:EF-hand domain pair